MCRLYGFHANEPTKVECTLVYAQNALMIQSRSDSRGSPNADGWGIATYENGVPHLEKRGDPAFRDLHFSETAERTYSKTVIAHIRRATVGTPSWENTHPFGYGSWVMAHNGTLTGFEQLRPRLESETIPELQEHRLGTTDSEQIFYWVLSRLVRAGVEVDRPYPDTAGLADLLAESVRELAGLAEGAAPGEQPRLNLLLTDGVSMVATRWFNSLHLVERRGVHDCEICGIPHVQNDPAVPVYRAVVIASEPVTHEPWREIPNQSVIAVDGECGVTVRPMV